MTNLLANSSSPYLRQHAENPVHWREWSDEAFDEALRVGFPADVLAITGQPAFSSLEQSARVSRQDGRKTVLFVSHNQSFVHRLATRIWDLRDGELVEYPGSLAEYYDSLERRESEAKEAAVAAEEAERLLAGGGLRIAR